MKCSVAMCTYNGEKFIEKQLNSILMQSRTIDEIIISDDGSNDNTLKIIKSILENSSVPYVIKENEMALGVLKNFEQAYHMCQGDIIFSCDQDDIWREDKVEMIMKYFEENPNIDLIATNARLIDQDDREMQVTLKEGLLFESEKEEFNLLPKLLKQYCITGATMAVKKCFFQEAFCYSDIWLHDGLLGMIAASKGSLLYLDEELTFYRLHGNNVCGIGNIELLKNGSISQLNKIYKKNIRKNILKSPFYYQDIAFEKYKQYKEILDLLISREIGNSVKVQQCVMFWNDRMKIKDMNLLEFLSYRKKWNKEHYYDQYMESSVFYYGDLYLWLIYHIFKKHNHIYQ